MSDCAFCSILNGTEPAEVMFAGPHTIGIVPLNPVTKGHVIFIPRQHVDDATTNPDITAQTMRDAALFVRHTARTPTRTRLYQSVNFITSVGKAATQTVFHLHTHVIPRTHNDQLPLPWHTPTHTRNHP